ncbi:TraU family protein [Sutterella megalosphaeroides]|uniref:Conjugal transfer protein n=1 Tax=Sutterella megalosphaeroides TaxID=2494234 RepID=A0A2Z6IB53_9BURK|nr:TraU family protein [Sutterella megalosphaeroides]BBF23482.1 hypothetical protein SUTMEG_13730 [Sutterella megalosphaeroides]
MSNPFGAHNEAALEEAEGAWTALCVLLRPVLFTFFLWTTAAMAGTLGLGATDARASVTASETAAVTARANAGLNEEAPLPPSERVRDLEAKARTLADEAKHRRETLLKRSRVARETPGACSGRVPDPVTDLCWSCMFPMVLGKTIPVSVSGNLPDVETDATAFCLCGSDINVEGGLNFSFWEPLRTAEVVRHPWCFPQLGGISMEGPGSSDHARTSRTEETRRRTAFWNVHWYQSPWFFITEAVADTGCLETAPWDLAYLSELDPLWDDTVTSFLLSPDAALFTSAASGGACAVDCATALLGTSLNSLYWCSGCQGRVFPLSGWMAAMTGSVQAWHLMAHRFAQKLTREGVLFSGHGARGQCGPYMQPLFQKDVWRTQLIYPSRNASGSACCQPLGRSTAPLGPYKTTPMTGEDGAILLWRKRDCCMTKKIDTSIVAPGTENFGLGRVPEEIRPKPASRDAFSALSAIANPDANRARPTASDRAHKENGKDNPTDASTQPRTDRGERIEPAKLLPEIREFDGYGERNDRHEGNDSNGFLREIRPTADASDSANILTDLRRTQVARALSAFTAMVARMTAMTSMTAATAHAAPTEEPRTVGGLRRLEIAPEAKSLFPSREPAAEIPEAPAVADPSNAQPRCDARVSVTVHPAEGPLYPHTDPDFLELLHATARRWEKSGLWQEALEKEIAAVRQAAETPTGARVLPRETRSRLHVRHVAWEEKDRRRLETLLGPFERRFLFIDAADPVQLAFAARLMKLDAKTTDASTDSPNDSPNESPDDLAKLARLTGAAGTSRASKGVNGADARTDARKDAEHLLPLRVVLTAGSRSAAERALPGTRIWFDQGGALTRRLGLNALPAFVRLTPEAHVLFQGALTENGFLRFDAPTDADGVERTESTSVMPSLGAR